MPVLGSAIYRRGFLRGANWESCGTKCVRPEGDPWDGRQRKQPAPRDHRRSRTSACASQPTTPFVLTWFWAASLPRSFWLNPHPKGRPSSVTHLLDEYMLLTLRPQEAIIQVRGRSGFDGSSHVRKARRGSTPPVIGVEQHNCQYAVCIRCLTKASASPLPRPAGRNEASSSGLAWDLPPEGSGRDPGNRIRLADGSFLLVPEDRWQKQQVNAISV